MRDSTRRSLRTWFHGLIAVLTAIPTVVPLLDSLTGGLPQADRLIAFGAALVTWAALVSKIINRLEESGLVPSWLKGQNGPPSV